MLYRETIAVCSEIHTKHIHTLCGQNVEFANVKPGGTYSNSWALEGYYSTVIYSLCQLPQNTGSEMQQRNYFHACLYFRDKAIFALKIVFYKVKVGHP
jgi:hypothetical protein